MEQAFHTPGLWRAIKGAEEADEDRCFVVVERGDRQYLIATIENGAPGDICDTEFANACLMAAAPALLIAANLALPLMEADLAAYLEGACLLDADCEPIRSTLPEGDEAEVGRMEAAIAAVRDAIQVAEGRR